MKVIQEEIFGPVVAAIPFKELNDDLVRAANDTIYGLAAGVWTRDLSKAHSLAGKLKAGTVWINCYNIFDAALPLVATSSLVGAVRWDMMHSISIPRRRLSVRPCDRLSAMHRVP